jgi:hypothetical protein
VLGDSSGRGGEEGGYFKIHLLVLLPLQLLLFLLGHLILRTEEKGTLLSLKQKKPVFFSALVP